jgi:flagellar protein FlbD
MIELTRLNNQPLLVNADLIKLVEQAPDTVITLVTGEKLVVRENTKELVRRVIEFRRQLLVELHNGPTVESQQHPTEVIEPNDSKTL